MRLSISVRFTLKDKPEGYLGLSGEYWNFGKDRFITLSDLILCFFRVAASYYVKFEDDAGSLNSEIDKIRNALGKTYFEELREE